MNEEAWTTCDQGHRHWGRLGAAGLFLLADGAVLLQHRAEWSHHGGTWGLPGGALVAGESPLDGALREATEEVVGVVPALVEPIGEYVDDHGSWRYTTVLARGSRRFGVRPGGGETAAAAWVALEDLGHCELHPGFAAALPYVLNSLGGTR